MRDLCVEESKRWNGNSVTAKALSTWQTADNKGHLQDADRERERQDEIEKEYTALHKCILRHIFLKRSGSKYLGLHNDLDNNYAKGDNRYAISVQDQQRMMEFCRPTYIPKRDLTQPKTFLQNGKSDGGNSSAAASGSKKSDRESTTTTTDSDQHMSNLQKKRECFKCDQKGKCTAATCEETTKEDGLPLNSKEVITEKCCAKTAKRMARLGGFQHFGGGGIIPLFKEVIVTEDPYEDWYKEGHTFVQNSLHIIHVDLQKTNYVFNQSTVRSNKFEVLCDNQSTSNVFVTKEFLLNIWPCIWTLCLCTQTGRCKINLIGDLPGVGMVWYYPGGVANILSFFKLAVDSNWDLDHTT